MKNKNITKKNKKWPVFYAMMINHFDLESHKEFGICVDTESWSKDNSPMILPKCIVTAILQDESTQYEGKGTSFEKQVKKEVKNIRYFL